ncbi:MAG: FAD-binding oxidoreductase [Shinella sp.]|nr:FAD-binding oxidoreductase [Shinella sp.]
MGKADSRLKATGQPAVDVLVVGGGIMGLWAALMAGREGLSVLVLERGRIGAGASGGVLGALMPHLPDRWNAKKQFQFDALVSLEAEVAGLEARTGLSAGYRRCGRVIPLAKPHLRQIALGHGRDAETSWRGEFAFTVGDEPVAPGWPATSSMACGLVFEGLAARVSPRGLLAVLRAALDGMANVALREGAEATAIDPVAGAVRLVGGERIAFGHAILSAGVSSFGFMDSLCSPLARAAGSAVKGQAALLEADIDPAFPIVFSDGLYVVAHEGGKVAVGSTSENTFADPLSTDHRLDDVISQARLMVPAIAQAKVVERWAGLRPKAIGRDPMIGLHPDFRRLSLMTGGFKISFGVAHELARAVIEEMKAGTPSSVPASFSVEAHLREARRA